MRKSVFTGRFAPSPTGPLHMGSLITALASYLDARSRGAQWYVRIDNLDPPREDPEAIADILSSLQAHGLHGDRPVDYQNEHQQRYAEALEALEGQLFYCTCSRRMLADHPTYPGTCRNNTQPLPDTAIRLRTRSTEVAFHDAVAGLQRFDIEQDYGDFIIKRRDGLWAYNFATAIDDGHDVSHVLRGQDLLHVTPQQIYLMQLLELPIPEYAHIPLLYFADGSKLSKQTHAPALRDEHAVENVRRALFYLGMAPPSQPTWQVHHWLQWAQERWSEHHIPRVLAVYEFS